MRDDAELMHATIHAFNQWIHETWTFNYKDRIFATPVITLPIIDKAIAELEWCVERGAKIILIRPAPVPMPGGSRSFALPQFDPFWRKVVESGVLVALHGSDSGYMRYMNDWIGPGEYLPFQPNPFIEMAMRHKAIQDTAASLTCHGLLTRIPELRFIMVENGGEWVAKFIENLGLTYKKMPHAFAENPVEAFRRNVWLNPFHEDNFVELAEVLGVDKLCFGSDWPHPEGMAEPRSFADHLPKSFSAEQVRNVMGGNLARALRVPIAA